ncbi:MAG: class I SAM-dependent rRNA methyltransferase [Candidatus Krumholzibacteria bacterium]|nr:class I SAM-dependent rRNA methyltransferase [Candidatus Krumholzibacteria bacterium]
MATVRLNKGREKLLLSRHPWVFGGAVERVEGEVTPGDIVDVVAADGAFVGRGYHNAQSRICVRLLSWDPDTAIDEAWWQSKVEAAISARASLESDATTDAYRLVHAEADLLPGLVADRYADVVVVQFLTAGVEQARDAIVGALGTRFPDARLYERSDTASRRREGLETRAGWIRGEGPARVEIREHGRTFLVNLEAGQKTGFYLDQRENRAAVAALAAGRRVLDAFSYTGAFGVYAATAGAIAITLGDTSAGALETAKSNLEQNETGACTSEIVQADVFEQLRAWKAEGRRFDMVVLDPPRFAMNQHQVDKALRAYKDINMLAMQLLEPGGILVTFSCSGAVDAQAFTLAVSWAGLDAGRSVQIMRRLSQGPDHPVLTSFPESEYLKGLLCRIV